MATLVKEKQKGKKKSKSKPKDQVPSSKCETKKPESITNDDFIDESSVSATQCQKEPKESKMENSLHLNKQLNIETEIKTDSDNICLNTQELGSSALTINIPNIECNTELGNTYRELNEKLQKIQLQHEEENIAIGVVREFPKQNEYDKPMEALNLIDDKCTVPSAPLLDSADTCMEEKQLDNTVLLEVKKEKVPSMSLEEAVCLYGGKEIVEVQTMSEREEAIVEAGPMCGPEHPLVDLLSTFRSSLLALEREKITINCGFLTEEKNRSLLWKIEKRYLTISEKCTCGANVDMRAVYDYAELQKEKLPAAKLRLEGLLRDVQHSYCHYQHAALLAHYQIEELISETVQGNKCDIREALSLLLQSLRLSDGVPSVYPEALQRWATVLADALIDERDLRQLLFLIHHLFRQTRSVKWAGRVLRMRVHDACTAARLIAVLDLMLTRAAFESALECTEELEAWEEVDVAGVGCAVAEGRLRERDMLRLLDALPLRDLVARLALIATADITESSQFSWGDKSGGHGVLKACCGVRALLSVLSRAIRTHATYLRMRRKLRMLAANVLHALAALHMQSKCAYYDSLVEKLESELEECFIAGMVVMGEDMEMLPATLLSEDWAMCYYNELMERLHEAPVGNSNGPPWMENVSKLSCAARVRAVVQVCADRQTDIQLAACVVNNLLQHGMRRQASGHKCRCQDAARAGISRVLSVHSALYATALHAMADINQVEPIEASLLNHLLLVDWRPMLGEVGAVLDDWARRCPQLLQHMLMGLDYTPHTGVCLESQIYIAQWLLEYVGVGDCPEWAWTVYRALRVHRSHWGEGRDAPEHSHTVDTLLGCMYAIMATEWGHCVPLACGNGVDALLRLAGSRPLEATHCLGLIMRIMAHSPESISLTPRFSEIITSIVNWGPSLMQRLLGRGGCSGAEELQMLVLRQVTDTTLSHSNRNALLLAWCHALWRPSLAAATRVLLDVAVRACQGWSTLDTYVNYVLQESDANLLIEDALRHASSAVTLCECVLRHVAHAGGGGGAGGGVYGRVLVAVDTQRYIGERVHVDNAIKLSGGGIKSEELIIYRTANALLCAPYQHPAYLSLCTLFCRLYFQRVSRANQECGPPVGLLFYSGLIKTRSLAQIKKRLQEAITYHLNQSESLKCTQTAISSPETPTRESAERAPASNDMFPKLSIADMIEKSSDSETSESDEERDKMAVGKEVKDKEIDSTPNMILYHNAAEKLLRECHCWFEEGERTNVTTHQADVARYIPHQAMTTAWSESIPRCPSPPRMRTQPSTQSDAHTTHHERALRAIRAVRDRANRCRRRTQLNSLLQDCNFKDSRAVLRFADQQLREVEKIASEWSSEVQRISQLDGKLWELVVKLRVPRPLPPVNKSCPQNCRPITIRIAEDEWCISTGVEREIQENRRSWCAGVRRVCRARPHFARTAAILHTLAKRIVSEHTAAEVCDRVWQYARLTQSCGQAHALLTSTVTYLAEKWLCSDGRRCGAMVARWSRGTSPQQGLCGALVCPQRAPVPQWVHVYAALLDAPLPQHALFSYLSKFDMRRWGGEVSSDDRQGLLSTIMRALVEYGHTPHEKYHALIELLSVHASSTVRGTELSAYVGAGARAAARCVLPLSHAACLPAAVTAHASQLTFDQIGHILRDIGRIWWEARSSDAPSRAVYSAYAPHFADVLRALQRAFVAAALELSYAPERVSLYSWSSILESWSAWVAPHSLEPLLPITCPDEYYTGMLQKFVDCILIVMEDCVGCEESLLRMIWSWTIDTYGACARAGVPQESRVQMDAVLASLAALPWTRQWHAERLALQINTASNREILSWCCQTLDSTLAGTWLRDVEEQFVAPTLAALFALFTCPNMQFSQKCLDEACMLPWSRLPEPAVDSLLERYFADHYSLATPYHHQTHFCLLVAACQLRGAAPQGAAPGPSAHNKRCDFISHYTRACVAPLLPQHVRAHTIHLLYLLTQLAPHISDEHLDELTSRAAVIMCIQPAADVALQVWLEWLPTCSHRLRLSAACAAAALTSLEHATALSDRVAALHLHERDSTGWCDLQTRWSSSVWSEASVALERCGLHAAYVLLLAKPHDAERVVATLNALQNADLKFVENETIISLWICVACRMFVQHREDAVRDAARGTLQRCLQADGRRSLLQLVRLQAAAPAPTHRHRVLCCLAQGIVSPSDAAAPAHEASSAALLGHAAAPAGGARPRLLHLVQAAVRLHAQQEIYFREELKFAEDYDC